MAKKKKSSAKSKQEKNFDLFKEMIISLCERFGVKDYNFFFYFEDLEEKGAKVTWDLSSKTCEVSFNSEKNFTPDLLEKIALHEFGHILTMDLESLIIRASQGYLVTEHQTSWAAEAFANRFEKGLRSENLLKEFKKKIKK